MVRSRRENHISREFRHFNVIAAAAALIVGLVGGAADARGEDETCLACHDSEGLEKGLSNGDILSLTVRGDTYANSVHGWVGCAGCHAAIDLESHPGDTTIESRPAYAAAASTVCLDCHARESLAEGPAHHARASAADGPACTACHNPHTVEPVAEWKAAAAETTYCLTCHEQALGVQLTNGEFLPLTVDHAVLRDSVHPDHDCTDCHNGFSKDAHETGAYTSTREHVISRAQICRQCHEDKFEQYEGSIHASLLGNGNLAAPVCSDCHGSHAVRPKAVFETVAGVPCKKCHGNIFEAYVGSTHGKARGILGHFEAPICADCHRAHEVGAAAASNQLRDACIGCHADTVSAHRAWLPNAALHLDAVSCPACHAPLALRRVELRLVDGAAQTLVSDTGDTLRFDARVRAADTDGNGLDAVELWNLVRDINRTGQTVEMKLQGRIGVRTGPSAHQLSDKSRAVRDCASCHQQGAEAFQNVTVSIVGRDGRPVYYSADKDVLNSVTSVNSVGGFYAIGGTRIKLLDVLLALVFLGGISVPIGHLTLKWLFDKYWKKPDGEGAARDS